MTSRSCRDDLVLLLLLLLLLLLHVGPAGPSPLDYCHRLDEHPPRLYATKTVYEQVRGRDLEPRQAVVDVDDDARGSLSSDDVASAAHFTATDDHSCQRQCHSAV